MTSINSFTKEYRFLSNFWYAKTVYNNIEFPTAEHAYQAAKSVSPNMWKFFSRIETPGEAKRCGQQIDIRPDWDEIKVDIMREILKSKFSDPTLKCKLIETGDSELIEDNNWGDVFWGVCNGKGENMLGKLLMEIRDEKRREK